MTDSSDETSETFDRVDAKSVHRLLTVIGQADSAVLARVERAYAEYAQSFASVLLFVKNIGWVAAQGTRLQLTASGQEAWRDSTEDSIRAAVVQAMISPSCIYRTRVAAYLGKYSLAGTEVAYRPSVDERGRESAIRNLLMDLRVVAHRPSDDCYIVESGREDIFAWALGGRRTVSRDQMKQLDEKRVSIGNAAERVVVAYEQARLGKKWWSHIEHVAQDAPFSPYDIKSVTILAGRILPRFIEVKAVSRDSFMFYWSKSELEMARLLRDHYFAYLLPTSQGTFRLEEMLVVQDPYDAIYKNQIQWTTEDNVIVCSKR